MILNAAVLPEITLQAMQGFMPSALCTELTAHSQAREEFLQRTRRKPPPPPPPRVE